jgi:hypothetical protein
VTAAGRLAVAVILVWLMPWRAARTIREQDRSLDALVSALAHLMTIEAAR